MRHSPRPSPFAIPALLATALAACAGTRQVTVPVVPAPAPTTAAVAPPSPASWRTSGRVPPLVAALESPRVVRVADSVLALLSLEEKLGQLTQASDGGLQTGPSMPAGNDAQVRAGKVGSFLNVIGAERTRALQRVAVEQSPHHVPLLFALDVIHGFRAIYPVPIGEAASFDTALAARDARVAAEEATAHGLHWTFAPMVDIARDPRWGRIVEGSGEDPFLGAAMAAARTRGFQGPRVDETTLVATAKHFAAYGASEGGRDYNSAEISERTLWETYLPPFEAAMRAGAGTFMAGFSDIGGTPPHASRWLLTEVLRERWGFNGLVVSDWAGIEELIPHGVAATRGEAGVLALHAGVDVDMSDGVYTDSLAAAVRTGRLAMADVDSAARRVLRLKAALGLFDDPYRYADSARERRLTMTEAQLATVRQAARESIVLLKNDGNVLPFGQPVRSIAVIGALAGDAGTALGSWAGAGRAEDAVSVLAGLQRAAASRGVRVTFAKGVPLERDSRVDTSGIGEAVRAARGADAVVLVLGERADMTAEAESRASIELPGAQLALAQAVARAVRGKRVPVVALLMNGRPLAMPWVADSVPAIVESWYLGVQHGTAVADVLFGDYNPGGKLPVTWPRATGQVPWYYDHRNTGRPFEAANKYTSKYTDLPDGPQFPFGHGLSYTTFDVGAPRLARASIAAGDSVEVLVDVRNTGAREGDEVVQLYVRDEVASVAPPVMALKGFQRVTLKAGEQRTLRFVLGAESLALWDAALRRTVEPGWFTIMAGSSSAQLRSARLEVTGSPYVLASPPPRMH